MCRRIPDVRGYDNGVTHKDGGLRGGKMDCSYSIDPTQNLVRTHIKGEARVDGLIKLIARITADPQFRPGMNSVCDMRQAFGSWDFTETQRYRDFLRHIAGDHSRRWAVIAQPGALVGAVHVLIVISQPISHRIKMQLFEEPQPAFEWAIGKLQLPGICEAPEWSATQCGISSTAE